MPPTAPKAHAASPASASEDTLPTTDTTDPPSSPPTEGSMESTEPTERNEKPARDVSRPPSHTRRPLDTGAQPGEGPTRWAPPTESSVPSAPVRGRTDSTTESSAYSYTTPKPQDTEPEPVTTPTPTKPAPEEDAGDTPDSEAPSDEEEDAALRDEPSESALEAPTPEPCTDTIEPPLAGPLSGHTDSTSEPLRWVNCSPLVVYSCAWPCALASTEEEPAARAGRRTQACPRRRGRR